ncbi:hypothetical protein OCH7691_01846 [Oceanibacterium hippocampi]|uniref:Uncharacterized protein n=1 Tax=Oceanibacterium hippocampi TaxID=745714 RepID=A0A1Y5SMU6_9PROT|nr:hypothetical protein OCH7691_01846 [Oceanibacterium hippocampi]
MCKEKNDAQTKIERLIAAMDRLAQTIEASTAHDHQKLEHCDSSTTKESMGAGSI